MTSPEYTDRAAERLAEIRANSEHDAVDADDVLWMLSELERLHTEGTAATRSVGRRNQHCMNCGDERGGPIGHETHECQHDSATAALRDALRPGFMLALSRLVQDAQQDHHALADAAGSTGPYIVQGCVVYGAEQLKDAVKTVWKTVPGLLSELEAAQARLDKGRAVLTDRLAEWAESEESWKRRPPKYLGDIEMRDREQAIAEEVSGLLEEFDRALGLGEEDTEDVPADAAPVIVYGASDDLIELRGAVDDELGAPYDKPATVHVDIANGQDVWLRIEYDPDRSGEWRIVPVSGHGRVLDFGHELVTIVPARGEDEGDDEDGCPGYSDKAIVRGGTRIEIEESS